MVTMVGLRVGVQVLEMREVERQHLGRGAKVVVGIQTMVLLAVIIKQLVCLTQEGVLARADQVV